MPASPHRIAAVILTVGLGEGAQIPGALADQRLGTNRLIIRRQLYESASACAADSASSSTLTKSDAGAFVVQCSSAP